MPYHNSPYSPVTLNEEWPKMGRFVTMLSSSTIGTILNGFFVASFFVEQVLRKPGFAFLGCLGFTDMIVTGVIMSFSTVSLLSPDTNCITVCSFLHWLGVCAAYSYSLYFMFVAIEEYLKLSRCNYYSIIYTSSNVAMGSVVIFLISYAMGAAGVYLKLDYDYCRRSHVGDIYFRAFTFVLFHLLPGVVTVSFLFASYISIRRRAAVRSTYRRSRAYDRDSSIILIHIMVYFIFLLSWLPYLTTSLNLQLARDSQYYNSIWFGNGRTVVTCFLYSLLNRDFRRAFGHVFNYCCCKSSLSDPLTLRHRRQYCTRVRLLKPNMFIAQNSQMGVLHGRGRIISNIRETQHL